MNDKEKEKKKLLSVKVPEEYADEVKKFAHDNYMSISDLLREALKEYMGNRQEARLKEE